MIYLENPESVFFILHTIPNPVYRSVCVCHCEKRKKMINFLSEGLMNNDISKEKCRIKSSPLPIHFYWLSLHEK